MDPDPVMSVPVVVVFDSGVGGLSVANEIQLRLPGVELVYICDNACFPYGLMPEAALVERVDRVISCAVAATRPDIVVVACNTASTAALPRLRSRLDLPVIGVVPAVKPAAAQSRNRVIGVLGTPATVRRAYTLELIERFAGDCSVLTIGSHELVAMAEALLAGEVPEPAQIAQVLAPFFDRPIAARPDTVVLACTHFPLLAASLQAAAPPGTRFVDSGRAIAERVRHVLGFEGVTGTIQNHRAFFTRDDPALRRRLPGFAARGFLRHIFFFED